MIYAFVEAQKATHRVSAMCRALKVSKSGFYGWRGRAPSARAQADALLSEKIARIHTDSRETYGAPRIHFELRTLGVRCARKRVARLMREAGLFGCGGRRRKARTTLRSHTERTPPAPDLVKRNFTPEAPDRLWVADITYVRTWEGWLYLSFVLDTYSRRIVGWSMANHLKTELVLDALNMAIYNRRPEPGLIHHSDRGSQGGFNRSKQHQPREVLSWDDHQAGPHGSQDGRLCVLRGLRGSAISASVSESSGMPSLRGSAARTPERVSASQVQSQRVGSAILAE